MAKKGFIIDIDCKYKNAELVEDDNGVVYSCTLNQTDIDANKNKYYIMQLLKNGDNYVLFIKYGRLGLVRKTLYTDYTNKFNAIKDYEKQFKSKTGNKWNSKDFVKKDGKYFLSDVSYEDELKDIDTTVIKIPDSKLDQKIQDLIKMISDVNMMNKSLINLDIDTKKLPIGKIKQKQIDMAKEVLDKIQKLIEGKSDNKSINSVSKMSSEYYTYIPNNCGMKKPPLIDTIDIVNKYKDILDDLRNIAIGVQIINNIKTDENPIDSIYKDIHTEIKYLDKGSQMWREIEKYVVNTHGPTHNCKLEVLDIYDIEQIGKREKYEEYCKDIKERMLLYHGTPQSCVLSIFKKDFYLDPTVLKDVNVVIAGKMFGYGVYFANMASKSFNYTRAHQTGNIGCFLLAEVAVGKMGERYAADYYITKQSLATEKCDSIRAIGKWGPSESVIIDNVIIPNGPVKEMKLNKTTDLRYDEFIVYDINQILIKYLVIVKNTGGY